MSIVIGFVVVTLFFVALAVVGLAGWTVDSRDVDFRLWPVA